jgi:hypothetical protein
MDREQARLILRSFRPDGADAEDVDFAAALKMAIEDRELGEWLAEERAFDAGFARCLGAVDLPPNLRADILACMAGEREDYPPILDAEDSAWVGAMLSIQPPASMRDELIAAMQASAGMKESKPLIFRKMWVPLAAAAGIALAFSVGRSGDSRGFAGQKKAVPIEALQAGFIQAYESPFFRLEEKRDDQRILIKHLKDRKLPCPKILPPGLRNVAGIGCRELVIDGKRGSLVCFSERENGTVHMVIFRREDVACDLSTCKGPKFAKQGSWVTAQWADDAHVFLMISHSELRKLAALF